MKKLENIKLHLHVIKQYLIYRVNLHDLVKQRSDLQKQKMIIHYNRGV